MAYFARVNDKNVVDMVIAVPNEHEHRGAEWATEWEGEGNWIQTSINARIRGVFARPGYLYDKEKDIFIVADETIEG